MNFLKKLIFIHCILHPLFSGTTGKVAGLIIDKETGEVLIGCNVMVINSDKGTASDEFGEFFILNISPGTYSIKFSMIGYETLILENVKIYSEEKKTENIFAEEAIKFLKQCINKNRYDVISYFILGNIYLSTKEYTKSVIILERARQINPKSSDVINVACICELLPLTPALI